MARAGWSAALPLVAALSLLACTPTVSTHGYRVDEAALAQLEPGRTTQDGVAQLLGSPSSIATFDDRVWYYVNQRTERKSFYQEEVVDQKVIAITFDPAGVITSIDQHGLDEARQIAFVARETPTSGNELSMFQQFIGNIGRFNPEGEEEGPGG